MTPRTIILVAAFFLIASGSGGCTGFHGSDPAIYLTDVKPLPAAAVRVGQPYELDLRKHFQLGANRPGGLFAGHPDIVPSVADTSIARVAYDFARDTHGAAFRLVARKPGETSVELGISWDGGGDTGERATTGRRFAFRVTP